MVVLRGKKSRKILHDNYQVWDHIDKGSLYGNDLKALVVGTFFKDLYRRHNASTQAVGNKIDIRIEKLLNESGVTAVLAKYEDSEEYTVYYANSDASEATLSVTTMNLNQPIDHALVAAILKNQ